MTTANESEWKGKDIFLPNFQLPSTLGESLGPKGFWQRKNLVLAFFHQAHCRTCKGVLELLRQNASCIMDMNAEILAIIPGDRRAAEELHAEMKLPFPFLFDLDDRVATLNLGGDSLRRPAVLVADRFGAIWHRNWPKEEDGSIKIEDSLNWLEFIEIQCPECDVLDSPPAS